jgi:hypothetical protein
LSCQGLHAASTKPIGEQLLVQVTHPHCWALQMHLDIESSDELHVHDDITAGVRRWSAGPSCCSLEPVSETSAMHHQMRNQMRRMRRPVDCASRWQSHGFVMAQLSPKNTTEGQQQTLTDELTTTADIGRWNCTRQT